MLRDLKAILTQFLIGWPMADEIKQFQKQSPALWKAKTREVALILTIPKSEIMIAVSREKNLVQKEQMTTHVL